MRRCFHTFSRSFDIKVICCFQNDCDTLDCNSFQNLKARLVHNTLKTEVVIVEVD